MIERQLLKIRLYRKQKAERSLARAHSALKESETALVQACAALDEFVAIRRRHMDGLYKDILGKEITIKKLEELRQSELKLNEKRAALEANIGVTKKTIKENEAAVVTAQEKRMAAQKQLNKAEELLILQQKRQARVDEKKESDQLDEFRSKKSPLFACGIFFLFFFSFNPSLNVASEEKQIYRALGQNLPLLLEDIAKRFDLKLEVDSIPNARVYEEYEFSSLAIILNEITTQYKLDWFIYQGTLSIVPKSKRKTNSLTFASAVKMEGFYHYLEKQKDTLPPPRFGAQRLLEEAVIIFTGPEVFLRAMANERTLYLSGAGDREVIAKKKNIHLDNPPKKGYGVMMFHLENAWAGDKEYKFADGVYQVSGVASVVRKLTGAQGAQTKGNVSEDKKNTAGGAGVPALLALARSKGLPIPSAAPAATPVQNKKEKMPTNEAVVLAEDRLNAVLVYDRREKYEYYKELIAHLDKKSQLVEIEAMIVDISKNHINDLGVSWRASKGKDAVGFGDLGESLAKGAIGLSLGVGGLSTALSSNLGGILAKIRFLENEGHSRIVSRPSVMTMDNLEAVLNTTQRFYVRVEGYQDSSLYPVEAGTTLKVTPHVIMKKNSQEPPSIRLFVTIEDGTIDSSESAMIDSIPSVQENKVKTQAVVEQGESLLIGGHIHTVRSESVSRVPFLGHIPLLGFFFSSKNETSREFVRLFIIRPRVYK